MLYIYFCILLLITFLSVYGILSCKKNAPSKIKLLGISILVAMLCRYVSLIVFFLIGNIRYIYLLKGLYFTCILFIPVSGAICLYIVIRSDRLKFNYIIIFSVLCLIGYVLLMSKFPSHIDVSSYVYIMRFDNSSFISWLYLALNTMLLLGIVAITGKSGTLKNGVFFIIVSSCTAIGEIIMCMMGSSIIPEPLIGEAAWLLTFNYCISTLKK